MTKLDKSVFLTEVINKGHNFFKGMDCIDPALEFLDILQQWADKLAKDHFDEFGG